MTAVLVGAAVIGAPSTVAAAPTAAPLDGAEWWFDAWRVYDMWNETKGAGMTVAVVESGVNAAIPELKGSVLSGVDLVSAGADGRRDYSSNGHGTAMANLIAANGSGTGSLGVAPEARILPVTIDRSEPPTFTSESIAQGIRWAADHGANVINLSIVYAEIGADCPTQIQDAVRYSIERNAVVVAGAGNDGDSSNRIYAPASCKGVLSVGAVDQNAQSWSQSERQSYVDVAAPGVDIVTADHHGRLSRRSGTSDATALTSAAVALVWSKHRDLTNREVVARLLYTLRDKPQAGTKDLQRGYGTLVPARALTDVIPRDAPNPVFDELAPAASPSPSRSSDDSGDQTGSAAAGGDSGGIPVPVFVIGGVGVAAVLVFLGLLGSRRRPRAVAAPPYTQALPTFYPPQSPGVGQQHYGPQQGDYPPQSEPPSNG